MDERSIIRKLGSILDPARFKHSLRVRRMVVKLAGIYGVDPSKASIAGLLHDSSRYLGSRGFIRLAKKLRMRTDPISLLEPKLLHAPLSAHVARSIFRVRDKNVLRAISSHTLGRPGMSKLEKIVYIADHIEEGRTHAGARTARRLAMKDLNKAIVAISTTMISYLLSKGLPVHPGTYEVRNYYLLNKK